MIKTIFAGLSIALMVPAMVSLCEVHKSPRSESSVKHLQEVWLTQSQAQRLLASVDTIINYIKELNDQNRAPRPGAQPGDPAYPGCQAVDLTAVMECLCQIKLQLICICEEQQSMSDVLGVCTDESVLLGSIVDKSDIDALCLSVVSLLKTVLLELRGAFTVIN